MRRSRRSSRRTARFSNGTDPREPAAWLATIARNECWGRIRSRMREPLASDEIDAVSTAPDPLAEAIRRADLAALWRAIEALPLQQRDAILLREFGGLSYDELAVALAVSGPAVESLLFRARQKLRAQLRTAYASLDGRVVDRRARAAARRRQRPGRGEGRGARRRGCGRQRRRRRRAAGAREPSSRSPAPARTRAAGSAARRACRRSGRRAPPRRAGTHRRCRAGRARGRDETRDGRDEAGSSGPSRRRRHRGLPLRRRRRLGPRNRCPVGLRRGQLGLPRRPLGPGDGSSGQRHPVGAAANRAPGTTGGASGDGGESS